VSFGRGSVSRLPSGAFPLVRVPQTAARVELRGESGLLEERAIHLDPYRSNEIDL